jgi:hypothetical protein
MEYVLTYITYGLHNYVSGENFIKRPKIRNYIMIWWQGSVSIHFQKSLLKHVEIVQRHCRSINICLFFKQANLFQEYHGDFCHQDIAQNILDFRHDHSLESSWGALSDGTIHFSIQPFSGKKFF